jgi:hypothetical protein
MLLDALIHRHPALGWLATIALLVLVALWGFGQATQRAVGIGAVVLIALLVIGAWWPG